MELESRWWAAGMTERHGDVEMWPRILLSGRMDRRLAMKNGWSPSAALPRGPASLSSHSFLLHRSSVTWTTRWVLGHNMSNTVTEE